MLLCIIGNGDHSINKERKKQDFTYFCCNTFTIDNPFRLIHTLSILHQLALLLSGFSKSTMTARSMLAQAATKLANISNETLQEAADRWLRKEDLTGVTFKSLVSAMENEFQIDLSEKRALFKRVLEEFTLENMKTEGDMETNDGEDEDEKGMEDSDSEEEETGMFANSSSKRKGSSSSQSPTKKGGSSNSGSGGGGGFKAEMQLSDELTALFGVSHLPRTEVTKKIWVYIKENDLQVYASKYV